MEGKDNIKDLFGEKLNGFEANVRPELWVNISSQIGGVTSVTAATGTSLFIKTIVGLTVAASVAVVSYFVLTEKKTDKIIQSKTISKPTETKKQGQIQSESIKEKSERVEKPDEATNFLNVYLSEVLNSSLGEAYTEENKITEHIITPVLINKENKDVVIIEKIQQVDKVDKNEVDQLAPEIVDVIEDEEYLGVLPNVFTPNGDRINDVFSIESKNLSDFSIVVIDKNSKTVYQSTDANFVWDGNGVNGEIVSKGTYVYYITARNSKGELVSKHSMLNIETDR